MNHWSHPLFEFFTFISQDTVYRKTQFQIVNIIIQDIVYCIIFIIYHIFYCSYYYTVIFNIFMQLKLNKIAKIQSGYISRGKIKSNEDGTHFLMQARDVDAHHLTYRRDSLIRFNPAMSRDDWILNAGDILFMARGARNFSVMLQEIPGNLLAAACFFIMRVKRKHVMPAYLCWYLNQAPAERYLLHHSGRGVHMPVVRRSTLEEIDIPMPTVEIQNKIVEMNTLMKNEQELIEKLAEKRKAMITSACLQTVRNS